MTRIIITGDRNWSCIPLALRVIRRIQARLGNEFVIVHGDATGVDHSFRLACEELGIAHEPHPVLWDKTGPAGGPMRNQAMVDLGAEYAIAVHRNLLRSRGTLDCVRKCLRAGIPVYLIDGANLERRVREEDLCG